MALDLVVTAVSTMFAFVAMIGKGSCGCARCQLGLTYVWSPSQACLILASYAGGIFGMNMKNGYEESHVSIVPLRPLL